MLADNVGFLRVSSINEETVYHVRRALNDFWVEGAEGIVLDLRRNKGGRYGEVIKLVDLFVDADETLWLEERLDDGKVKRIKSSTQPLTDLPLVVLIDNATRSGGELIACALKRNQRARLVGQTTVGDGFLKNLVERPGGKTKAVKIARILCRRGVPIAERGVEPQVQMPADATPQEVLDRAIKVLKAEVP
jgi:carboxyl-terminal processing protease